MSDRTAFIGFAAIGVLLALATHVDAQVPMVDGTRTVNHEGVSKVEIGTPLTIDRGAYFSGHYGNSDDATAIAQRLGCYEDEVVVMVIADVLPDNGQPPNVDWGPIGMTGEMFCIPADDLTSR